MKEGWKYKKLGEITTQISDGSHNPPKGIESSNYPMLSSKNIFFDKFDYDSPRYLSKEDFETENKRTNISDGDVLLTIVGTVGRTCCVQTPFTPFTLQRSVAVLKPKKDIVKARFLMYFLHSLSDFWEIEAKGVAQKGVYLKQVGKIPIPIPSLSEQQHIVEELDLLSSIIEKKKAQLNELDNLAQSLFYEMFGDPITNEKGWDVKKFGEIGKVITGSTPSTKDEENYNSCDYCFIKPSDIAKDNITRLFKSEFHISSKAYDNSRQLPKGSVLVTCIGIVGKVGILEVNATCNQQINAIVPYSFVQSQYLAYSILLQKKIIESIANAPVVPIINKKEFSILSTPIPPIDLQQQFASKIEAIEHQKELIKQSIKEVETLFNSRMDYYFN